MAQFDVFLGDEADALLLDCQANTLRHFDTRLVVPLMRADATRQADRLHPIFEIDGRRMVMVTQLASAVPTKLLRTQVANLDEHRYTITSAIDVLTAGV